MRKMGLRGRSQEEQLLPQRRVGGSPHSSALLNGAAHEYCMIPEVGLPGRVEPSRAVASRWDWSPLCLCGEQLPTFNAHQ